MDAWKTTGNELFKAGRWVPAAIAYTRGLRIDPTAIVLLANRSEVYLCLKWHSGALADARRVRSDPDTPDALRHKALLREVKAEYARGNYATAHARFVEWQRFHPKGLDVADWISRSLNWQTEQKSGDHNWTRMYKHALTNSRLDAANYRGPTEVRLLSHRVEVSWRRRMSKRATC